MRKMRLGLVLLMLLLSFGGYAQRTKESLQKEINTLQKEIETANKLLKETSKNKEDAGVVFSTEGTYGNK